MDGDEFAQDDRVRTRIEQFVDIVDASEDLSRVVSRAGLSVASFSPVLTLPADELDAALRSDEELPMDAGPECGTGGCPQSLRGHAERCADIARDPSTTWSVDEPVGGTGALNVEEYTPPAELTNYHYVATMTHPEQEAGGGWSACYWFFASEQDSPVLAGLTFDAQGL